MCVRDPALPIPAPKSSRVREIKGEGEESKPRLHASCTETRAVQCLAKSSDPININLQKETAACGTKEDEIMALHPGESRLMAGEPSFLQALGDLFLPKIPPSRKLS